MGRRGEDVPVTEVRITATDRPLPDEQRRRVLAAPVFGESFGDHMVTSTWRDGGWGPLELGPLRPLALHPATLALHYGQSVFEALKAYAQPDGSVALFRPGRNAARFAASARRIEMPELEDGVFELACALLAEADRGWVPDDVGAALYLRPFLFGSEAHLSVRPAREYRFVVIASPVASYFGDHLGAITVAVESGDVRASPGGTGSVKFAGNYAAGFAAHGRASASGADQVLWLDATEHRWVEELNAMNVLVAWRGEAGTVLSTPPLGGTILEGVTRDSLLALAAELPQVAEVRAEPVSIDQLRAGIRDATLLEVMACGTAAVVVPVGTLLHDGDRLVVGDGTAGPLATALRRRLVDLQQGRAPDPHGWRVPVRDVLEAAGVAGDLDRAVPGAG